jgi:TatD DNase family protein
MYCTHDHDSLQPVIDTHAHLTNAQFAHDLDEVLRRAFSAGVSRIIVVSESISDGHAALRIAAAHRGNVHAALGLHPAYVASLSDAEADAAVAELRDLIAATNGRVVAIGEVGLDFTPRVLASGTGNVTARQVRVFKACISLARDHGLPLSVHSRGAGRHAIQVLEDEGACRSSVLHAFDGRAVYAERAASSGCYLSIPPSVVRSEQMQKMIRRVPLENLLVETDSPVLGVEVSTRNEPAMAVRALEMIAAVKCLKVEYVRSVLAHTSRRVFPRAFEPSEYVNRRPDE